MSLLNRIRPVGARAAMIALLLDRIDQALRSLACRQGHLAAERNATTGSWSCGWCRRPIDRDAA